jgi:hypothetical protein
MIGGMNKKTITKEQAKRLLKENGHKLADMADYLEIKPRSLSMRWTSGELSISNTLMLCGYLALHDKQLQQLARFKDDAVIAARLQQLLDDC